jgi:hypothetical protein
VAAKKSPRHGTQTPDNATTPPLTPRTPWLPASIFLILLLLYLAFPSRHYDGDALKYSGVFHSSPAVGASNHPFSAYYFYGWWRWVQHFSGEDFVRRMDLLTAMNAFLGAGSAALGSAWIRRRGIANRIAVAVGLLLGLSQCWIYHSTQTTEPMAAQFLVMLSLWIGSLDRIGSVRPILSAACWAASVASYQSYFLAGPFVLLLAAPHWRGRLLWTVSAGMVGFALFGMAARLAGASDISGFIAYLTAKHDGQYWGFFRWSQVVRVPLGLAASFAKPWPSGEWPGLKLGFPRLGTLHKGLLMVQILITWALAAAALLTPAALPLRNLRWTLIAGFAVTLFPPLYLNPLYAKLWLLPLSFLILLAGVVASNRPWAMAVMASAVAVVLVVNLPRGLWYPHSSASPDINAAKALRESLSKNDLLICDGWDDSGTFCAMYPDQNRLLLMFTQGGSATIWKRVRETQEAGHKVFIYGVVERSPETWMMTDLGTRPGLITYDDFKSFRDQVGPPLWTGKDRNCSASLYPLPPTP